MSQAIVLTFDLTSQESFDHLKNWLDGIYQHSDPNIIKVLVGNKSDLIELRQISAEAAREMAETHKMEYFEVSAKTKENIEELSNNVTQKIYQKLYAP